MTVKPCLSVKAFVLLPYMSHLPSLTSPPASAFPPGVVVLRIDRELASQGRQDRSLGQSSLSKTSTAMWLLFQHLPTTLPSVGFGWVGLSDSLARQNLADVTPSDSEVGQHR